jgi:dephospho-CoA kinase
LADVVFERPEELSWLESVLFPRVGEQIARWRTKLEQAEHNPKMAVVEVPLLAGIEGIFDAVVAVVAEEETRRRRVGARRRRAQAANAVTSRD